MADDLTDPTIGYIVMPVSWDGAEFHVLRSNAAGQLEISVVDIGLGMIRAFNYDGGAWNQLRGLPSGVTQVDIDSLRGAADVIPLHYHSQWRERFSRVVDAGQDWVETTAVPAGMVAVVTCLAMWTNDAATTAVIAATRDGVTTTFIYRDSAPALSIPYTWSGVLYLHAGDYIRFDPVACPVGGTVYGDVSAYMMRAP